MSKSVNVIGAGGHSRPVIELLKLLEFEVDGIYDESFDVNANEQILGIKLKGRFPSLSDQRKLIFAVGINERRKSFFEEYQEHVYTESIIHPSSLIESSVKIGKANVVFARSYLSSMVRIGDNNILNSGAIIEHESNIGSHCHISVGAIICGRVFIGDDCFIGAGAIVKDKISIANNVTVGAGSVVVKDITESGVYIGNPAKRLR